MKKIFACSAAFAVALLIHIPLVSSAAENDSIPIANSSQEVLSNKYDTRREHLHPLLFQSLDMQGFLRCKKRHGN